MRLVAVELKVQFGTHSPRWTEDEGPIIFDRDGQTVQIPMTPPRLVPLAQVVHMTPADTMQRCSECEFAVFETPAQLASHQAKKHGYKGRRRTT